MDRDGGVQRSVGGVKFWKAEKGWGAISSDDLPPGRDAFAHFSAVVGEGYRSLEAGQRVEFTWHRAQQDSVEFVADRIVVLED